MVQRKKYVSKIAAGVQAASLGAVLLSALFALSACASSGSNQGDMRRDIVTETDATNVDKRARIRYELAAGYFEQEKYTVALDEVKQVLQLEPNAVDAWVLRGLIYLRLEQTALAEESFRRAQVIAPKDGAVARNYAWVLCTQKRYAESDAQFKRAVAVDYELARTYMSWGVCQREAGQKAAAEDNLRKSLDLEPLNPISGYHLAGILFDAGQYEQARFYARRVNNGEFSNAASLWLGIRIEHALNNTVAQGQLASQLRSRYPDSPEAGALDKGAF
jgi:type IV pilus assembly protein PilF